MNYFIDKSKLRENFSKAAKNYNKKAILQKIIANELIKNNLENLQEKTNILDLGSGTGFIGKNIKDKLPFVNLINLDISYQALKLNPYGININGDIDFLPFKNQTFDLIISSLTFQWLNNIESAINNIKKLLNKKGILSFTILIDGSLEELKISCKNGKADMKINQFIKINYLKDIISQNFQEFSIRSKILQLEYSNLYDLLKSIKLIGASYAGKNTKKILTKKDFDRINDFYLKNFASYGKIKASWNIAYVFCKY